MTKLKKIFIYRLPEIICVLGAAIIVWTTWFILDNIGTVSDSIVWVGFMGVAVMLIGTVLYKIREDIEMRLKKQWQASSR